MLKVYIASQYFYRQIIALFRRLSEEEEAGKSNVPLLVLLEVAEAEIDDAIPVRVVLKCLDGVNGPGFLCKIEIKYFICTQNVDLFLLNKLIILSPD